MKSNKILAAILTALLFLIPSCTDNPGEEKILSASGLFAVSEYSFQGIARDQSVIIRFNAPQQWTAQILDVSSWLKADVLHGQAGESAIVLSPRSDNFSDGPRNAILEIMIDGYEPYRINIVQESASTNEITLSGLDQSGYLNLQATESGTEFVDTVWVTSRKAWAISQDEQMASILSFQKEKEPVNGTETTIPVIVRAQYSSFPSTALDGQFYITSADGKAVTVKVRAQALLSVHEERNSETDPLERVSFEMTDTMQLGVYATGFYVESNVRWHLGAVPEWIETALDWSSGMKEIGNVMSDGQINPERQFVSLRVRQSALSVVGKSAQIDLIDDRGVVVKSVFVTFAGVGRDYLHFNLMFPAVDPYGNPWGFEASEKSINPDSPSDYWKQVRRSFTVTTSKDFTSISDAPFHLVLVKAVNGMPVRQEVSWAHLELGTQEPWKNGELNCREIVIAVNDRGDADDIMGNTDQTQWRSAFMFLVPGTVNFNDLWDADDFLKSEYSENMVILSQKNNPDADYSFAFQQIADGDTVSVSPFGASLVYDVVAGSYNMCDLIIMGSSGDDIWTDLPFSACMVDIKMDQNDNPVSITFSVGANEGERNPFTGEVTGSDRLIRVEVYAFLGDDVESRKLFTFYIDQKLIK